MTSSWKSQTSLSSDRRRPRLAAMHSTCRTLHPSSLARAFFPCPRQSSAGPYDSARHRRYRDHLCAPAQAVGAASNTRTSLSQRGDGRRECVGIATLPPGCTCHITSALTPIAPSRPTRISSVGLGKLGATPEWARTSPLPPPSPLAPLSPSPPLPRSLPSSLPPAQTACVNRHPVAQAHSTQALTTRVDRASCRTPTRI